MSQNFNGFSQDEINKVSAAKANTKNPGSNSQNTNTLKQAFRGQHSGIRRMPEKWSRSSENVKKLKHHDCCKPSMPPQVQQKTRHPTETVGVTKTMSNDSAPAIVAVNEDNALAEVKLDKSLSASIQEALFYQPLKQGDKVTNGHSAQLPPPSQQLPNDANESSLLKVSTENESTASDESLILPTMAKLIEPVNVASPFKGISLKDFESHRKMIEEQNKQKKELLYKAIEKYSQKTAAEARKIEEIRNELSKLDNDLAVDVAILRKQIDNACVHFASIEKQYMKIEQQFLKAKIDLHNAAEKKELLTEHLCTVIAHNEDRKAQKLSELMEKVGLGATGEYIPKTLNTDK